MIECKNCFGELTFVWPKGWTHIHGQDEKACSTPAPNYESCSTFALDSILAERVHQDKKWGEQNHNPYIYLTILLEEVGELAQAILQTQFGGDAGGWDNVRKEAVHTAAVALALLECLDRDNWREDDVHLQPFEDGR